MGRLECRIFIQVIFYVELQFVLLCDSEKLKKAGHGNRLVVKPVVDGAVTQLDAGCTELLVKLYATSKEPNHTLHVDAWCFHVENMRILR